MCMVSMISDDYFKRRPDWFIPEPIVPQQGPIVVKQGPDEETKQLLREIIKKLDKLDKKEGLKDCMDETKKKFYKIIELDESELEELTADKKEPISAAGTLKPSNISSTVKLTPGTPFK